VFAVFSKITADLWDIVRHKGGGEDTTFESTGSEKVRGQGQGPSCRGQVASRPRTERLEAKNSRTRLKIHENINENIVIMISQAFKRNIVQKWVRFEFAYMSVLAKSIATILCLLHPT